VEKEFQFVRSLDSASLNLVNVYAKSLRWCPCVERIVIVVENIYYAKAFELAIQRHALPFVAISL
jgi:hypothetical protein